MKNPNPISKLYHQLDLAGQQGLFRDFYYNNSVVYIAFHLETPTDVLEKMRVYIMDNYQTHIREMYFTNQHTLKIYLNVS